MRQLRVPSVVLGLVTAARARLVSKDRWTPVVAAATCAFVPKFVFVSGVVNNDSLANDHPDGREEEPGDHPGRARRQAYGDRVYGVLDPRATSGGSRSR